MKFPIFGVAIVVGLSAWSFLAAAQGAPRPTTIRVGMSFADAKLLLPSMKCEVDDSVETCIDIVPAYSIGTMPAFVQMNIRRLPVAEVTAITVRFHPRWSEHFFVKANEHFGKNFKPAQAPVAASLYTRIFNGRSDDESRSRAYCPKSRGDVIYVHGTWKRDRETIEFWSFTGRTCSAKLVYKAM